MIYYNWVIYRYVFFHNCFSYIDWGGYFSKTYLIGKYNKYVLSQNSFRKRNINNIIINVWNNFTSVVVGYNMYNIQHSIVPIVIKHLIDKKRNYFNVVINRDRFSIVHLYLYENINWSYNNLCDNDIIMWLMVYIVNRINKIIRNSNARYIIYMNTIILCKSNNIYHLTVRQNTNCFRYRGAFGYIPL